VCAQCAASQEVVEEHLKPVGWREDSKLTGTDLCTAPLQADASVRHGRDRRCTRLQERVNCRQLHQGLTACFASVSLQSLQSS